MTRNELIALIRRAHVDNQPVWSMERLTLRLDLRVTDHMKRAEVDSLFVFCDRNFIILNGDYVDIIDIVLEADPALLPRLRQDAQTWCAQSPYSSDAADVLRELDPLRILMRRMA